jgi:hypothetical protein
MGFPVTERGGPPGGGGMGRPDALVGACVGAEGGFGGPPVVGGEAGRVGGAVGRVGGAAAGAAAAGAAGAGGGAGAADTGWAGGVGGAGRAGAGAAARAAGAAGTRAGAAGTCSEAGRLVTNRDPDRLTGGTDGVAGRLGAGPSLDTRSGAGPAGAVGSGLGARSGLVAGSTLAAAAFLLAGAFLAGAAGSSGCTRRRRPSRSAFRRARSAWASSMDDEWLLTPIPSDRHRSSASLLVRPSSCASS